MSVWTHVAACIRVDTIDATEEDIKEILGNIITCDDLATDDDVIVETKVPMGSEGSLKYIIDENPSETSIAKYVVTIFGDLRDYENVEEIVEWLNTSFSKFMIRQGIVTIEVEGKDISIFSWDHDEMQFVLQKRSEYNYN